MTNRDQLILDHLPQVELLARKLHRRCPQVELDDLISAGMATTVEGQDITFSGDASSLQVNGQAAVVCGDVQVAKATVHIIDSVLMPS